MVGRIGTVWCCYGQVISVWLEHDLTDKLQHCNYPHHFVIPMFPISLPPVPTHTPTLTHIYEACQYPNLILQSKSKLIIHFTCAMLTMSHCLCSGVPTCVTIDDVGSAILYKSSAAQIASTAVVGPGSWKVLCLNVCWKLLLLKL